MPFSAVVTLLTALFCLQVDCDPVFQEAIQTDVAEGWCPVTLTSAPLIEEAGYFETIKLQVWTKTKGVRQIDIYRTSKNKESFLLKNKCPKKTEIELNVRCCMDPKTCSLRNLEIDFKAEVEENITVSYSSKSTHCSVHYLVPDPRPDFSLSVNKSSKIISVEVDSADLVYVRWCYEKSPGHCSGGPSQATNRSAVLRIPYLLPCVCVEVYYTYKDAARHKKCPFRNESLIDIKEILQTSKVELFKSHLQWSSVCPACRWNVSAALCWKMHNHACIPVPNSTLEKENDSALKFNTSTVDKHPQMCVQFSIQDRHTISCLFDADEPSWETHITPGRQSMLVHITSTEPAKFSAQLCVVKKSGCLARGQIHSETKGTNQKIKVPIQDITERPCVQVWQSDPALSGRRILCMDYTHKRWGVCAVGVLVFVSFGILLGFFIHRALKSGMAGWLTIPRPLLLVCSSDEPTHLSAVCALASILQEELDASVHTALWAHRSQTQGGNGARVADLGPLPWLYGQWEAIRKVQGKMLIVWSPEAKRTNKRWRVLRANMENSWRPDEIRASLHDYLKTNGWRLGKAKQEKRIENKSVKHFEDEDSQKEASTFIKPVFVAALASLEAALQEGKGKDVAIVYFNGLCHSRDIPDAFRGVPRYCLPQEFSRLTRELAEVRGKTKSGEFRWHCWPRLLSKLLSVWLARRLALKLQTVLPQTTKTPSDQEQERLHASPWGTGKL